MLPDTTFRTEKETVFRCLMVTDRTLNSDRGLTTLQDLSDAYASLISTKPRHRSWAWSLIWPCPKPKTVRAERTVLQKGKKHRKRQNQCCKSSGTLWCCLRAQST